MKATAVSHSSSMNVPSKAVVSTPIPTDRAMKAALSHAVFGHSAEKYFGSGSQSAFWSNISLVVSIVTYCKMGRAFLYRAIAILHPLLDTGMQYSSTRSRPSN